MREERNLCKSAQVFQRAGFIWTMPITQRFYVYAFIFITEMPINSRAVK